MIQNGIPSIVVTENNKPAYVVMDYEFFERNILTRTVNQEISIETETLAQSIPLDDLDEQPRQVSGQNPLGISDLPIG